MLLCDNKNIKAGNLGTPSKIAKFMGVKAVRDITAEMQSRVDEFFVHLATGEFDDVLMQWSGLNKTVPSVITVEAIKGVIHACLRQMLRKLARMSWMYFCLSARHMFHTHHCFTRRVSGIPCCFVGHPRVPPIPPLQHHTVYVMAKRDEDEAITLKRPKKADDVTALAVALYDSVKLLPWYTSVVLGMQPQPDPVDPMLVDDDAIPVIPAASGFDAVRSARSVYGSYLPGDATDDRNWMETKGGARSVLSEYNKMNIHYYIQKGR
jgi:hypothetical protein